MYIRARRSIKLSEKGAGGLVENLQHQLETEAIP